MAADRIPTLAEHRIEACVTAFREGLATEALHIATVDMRPTLQPHHVDKALVRILVLQKLPSDLHRFVFECDQDGEIDDEHDNDILD